MLRASSFWVFKIPRNGFKIGYFEEVDTVPGTKRNSRTGPLRNSITCWYSNRITGMDVTRSAAGNPVLDLIGVRHNDAPS